MNARNPNCPGWPFPRCPLTNDVIVHRRRGFGAEVEDIVCPPGFQANGDAQGNVWCEDKNGQRVSATFQPSTKATVVSGGAQQAGMGVAGWGLAIAAALLVGALVVKERK